MASLISLIIPTYNRPRQLSRTLQFLQARSKRIPILVVDGSEADCAGENRLCRMLGCNITYVHSPARADETSWQNYRRRISEALDETQTPYVVYCADDDLLVTENAILAAQFLDKNSDYVGAHGKYFHYRFVEEAIRIEALAYSSPSIDGNEATGRLIQLFSRYEAVFYAVFRTEVKRKLIDFYQEREQPLWPEIYHATGAALLGKIKRLDTIFSLRNVGLAPHPQKLDNFGQWVVTDFDGFLVGYYRFRGRFVTWLKDRNACLPESQLNQVFDIAFMLYVGSEFDPRVWIEACFNLAIEGESEKALLVQWLERELWATRSPRESETDLRNALRAFLVNMFGERPLQVLRKMRKIAWRRSAPHLSRSNGKLSVAPSLVPLLPESEWALLRR